ncbi:hypothetical protein C0992_011635 [Termitomyces sp. T32_za158]|nr:hypothetical protein C0992_011635 [Termitomyces sp. T32_za158]
MIEPAQIEDCLFVVPKYHFMRYKGEFDWMWDMDEETRYQLDDIKKADFRAFLKFLHPLYCPHQPDMTADEWISVLKLASKWTMPDIRKAAIKALDAQPWLRKIVLAREYGVLTWLRNGYLYFITRQESLSIDDVGTLGLNAALKLINMREELLLRNRGGDGAWSRQYAHNESRIDSYWAVMDSCSDSVDKELSQELRGANSAPRFDAVARVVWARSQNVQSLRLAYIELTKRAESISMDESLELGLETTINICRARERFFRACPGIYSAENSSTKMEIYFGDEFDAVTGKEHVTCTEGGTKVEKAKA